MNTIPRWLGTFTRSRADIAAQASMIGTTGIQWYPGSNYIIALNNNDPAGNHYAILDMLAWVSGAPHLASAALLSGATLGSPVAPMPLVPGMPSLSGSLGSGADARIQIAQSLFVWNADGRTWLRRGGAPLAIVQPGFKLAIAPAFPVGLPITPFSWIQVSFLYTLWETR